MLDGILMESMGILKESPKELLYGILYGNPQGNP